MGIRDPEIEVTENSNDLKNTLAYKVLFEPLSLSLELLRYRFEEILHIEARTFTSNLDYIMDMIKDLINIFDHPENLAAILYRTPPSKPSRLEILATLDPTANIPLDSNTYKIIEEEIIEQINAPDGYLASKVCESAFLNGGIEGYKIARKYIPNIIPFLE